MVPFVVGHGVYQEKRVPLATFGDVWRLNKSCSSILRITYFLKWSGCRCMLWYALRVLDAVVFPYFTLHLSATAFNPEHE